LQKSGVATIDSLLWRGRKSAPTDIVPEGLNRPWGRWRKPVGESSAGHTPCIWQGIVCYTLQSTNSDIGQQKATKSDKKREGEGKGGVTTTLPLGVHCSLFTGYCLKTNLN